MIGIEQLSFDPTDADSIAASHSVGAYVRAGTDGDLIGSETLGGEEWLRTTGPIVSSGGTEVTLTGTALDVNIASGSITVTEEDVYAEDSAHVSGDKGTFTMAIRVDDLTAVPAGVLAGTEGDYQGFIADASGALYVAGTDFDIRDLDANQDNVAISDGTNTLAVTAGGAINAIVTATDLDIRDIDAGQDNIAISDGTDTLAINGDGSINSVVTATDLDIRDLTHVSDSVRLGDGTAFYTSTTVGSDLGLDVYVLNDILVSDVANTAILNTQKNVTTTTGALLVSQQAARKYLYVQNLGPNKIYIGASGVTTADGIEMSRGSLAELRLGPALSLHAVASAGTVDTRLMQLA